MVISYNVFQATNGDDSEGFVSGDDEASEKSHISSTEKEDPPPVTLNRILECLIRTAIKLPSSRPQVEHSLGNLAERSTFSRLLTAVFKLVESGSPGFRRAHRLVIYEILSSPCLLSDSLLHSEKLELPTVSVKSFVIRLITDIDRSNCESINQDAIERFSKLIAILSVSSFDDLVLCKLMSPEFVSGKPTVATTIVQDALVEIFAKLLQEEKYARFISELLGKIETTSVLRMNNEIITSVALGVHRTRITLPAQCFPSISVIYSSVIETISPESIRTALFLLSLVPRTTIVGQTELEENILLIGAKGLDNEDFRADFKEFVSLIWKHGLDLFASHTEEFLSLVLALGDPDIWALGPDFVVVPYLCSLKVTLEDERKVQILHALASIASFRRASAPEEIVNYIESFAKCEVAYLADETVGALTLISSLDESLVSPVLVSFVESLVCSPASAVAKRFPKGIEDADLVKVRAAAQSALLTIASKSKESRAQRLLSRLLECLEHMPRVGIATICQSVTILVSKEADMVFSIPESQGFLVLIWLLISVTERFDEEPVEPIIECLVVLSEYIHPSLDGIYSSPSRLVRLADSCGSIGEEFAFVIGAIDFASRQDKDRYFNNALETVVVLLSSPFGSTVPALIEIWGELMRFVLADQSVGLFSNRIGEFLNLQEALTANEDCIRVAAMAIGRLADRRMDVVFDILSKTLKQAELVLTSQGAGNAVGSISNSLRIKSNKSSFRGMFVFEKSERIISCQIAFRELALRGIGFAIEACPENRLSEIRVKECISDIILRELRSDCSSLQQWLAATTGTAGKDKNDGQLDMGSTLGAVETVSKIAQCVSRTEIENVHVEYFEKFRSDFLDVLLRLAELASEIDQIDNQIEPILDAITQSIQIPHLEMSQDQFSAILSTTLHALVQSVPDNPAALSEASPGAIRLANRCSASANVLRALFGHADTWTGFSRLIKAVFALGSSGPLPLLRWVCLRIACVISEETDVVNSDQDIEEFTETIALVIPRLCDSYSPVRELALHVIEKLFMRSVLTKDFNLKDKSPASVISQALPDKFVPGFLLHLIPSVHDSDSAAAESAIDLIFNTLGLRSSVFASPDSAADAVVDGILSNASKIQVSNAYRVRLVTSLKFIAAVRFPIAVKEVLDSSDLTCDKVHAIHSFARDKSTVVHLTQDLMSRITERGAKTKTLQAVIALGHMLDCYQDTGVSAICRTYFSEIFATLLLTLWHFSDSPETIKIVLHKLCRAANVGRLPDSVTTETGVAMLIEKNSEFTRTIFDFIRPFLEQVNCERVAATALACQLMGMDSEIDSILMQIMTERIAKNPVSTMEIGFALKGLQQAVKKLDSFHDEKTLLVLATSFIGHSDKKVCLEALKLIHALTGTAGSQQPEYLMTVSLGNLRRVVDHTDDHIRSTAFHVLASICGIVAETKALEIVDDQNGATVRMFYSAISDLWIPCLVRSQEESPLVADQARLAFIAVLNAALADQPVAVPTNRNLQHLMSLVRSEICVSSHVHLNSCSYYLLGLPSVSKPVMLAAANLTPVLIELLPQISVETGNILTDLVDKLLTLSLVAHELDPILSDVVVQTKRLANLGVRESS